MKRFAAALLLACLPSLAWADVVLDIDGEKKTVQVDKVVIVKEDRLVITKQPFTVKAPPGWAFYEWSYPPGLTVLKKHDKLEVRAAPNGECTIGVTFTKAIWKEERFVTEYGQVTFYVGDIGPQPVPPGPTPPAPPTPGPLSPLAQSLKASLDQDLAEGSTKANLATLSQVYRQGAPMTQSDKFATIGDLYFALTAARKLVLADNLLLKTRMALAKYLDERLPTKVDTPLGIDTRNKASGLFVTIADALEELSK